MNESKELIIRIGGEGGEGVISAGEFITQAAARAGLHVLTFKTFPAEIRGGYAMYQLRASNDPLTSQGDGFDVMVAFNGEAYEMNKSLLREGTAFVYDGPGGDFEPENLPGVYMYPVPMTKISKGDLGSIRSKNMVALGAVAQLFSIPMERLRETIQRKFQKLGVDVVEMNLKALDMGASYVRSEIKKTDPYALQAKGVNSEDVLILSGNEAVAVGALAAGCRYYAAYPITPATEIANWLARYLPKANGVLLQEEDEIAAIASAIGASYAGAKVMTATSGPGLSLMSELLGLAGMIETPLVVVDVQRAGPSTGMPTKHEQSDLFLAAHGGHGDIPRIVLGAGSVEDCFYLTIKAFNLAEKYQVPVLLLSDTSLGIRTQGIKKPNLNNIQLTNRLTFNGNGHGNGSTHYKRYEMTESGISPMAIPGQAGGAYIATGLEHDEKSDPIYTQAGHSKMTEKRFRKLAHLEEEDFSAISWEGDDPADLGIISWGSTHGSVQEALVRLRSAGYKVAALYPHLLFPVPAIAIERFAARIPSGKILVPEVNFQGQFADLISAHTTVKPIKYPIYGGLPFNPEMIVNKVKEVLKK
ncbi:MAG TPA: 2-oxoacid:acceptor oxidoreductase subunit alpha [bacterium]|nr:2-oxoacid:acceptor oxidoreductase subunit alpha [bacterium]